MLALSQESSLDIGGREGVANAEPVVAEEVSVEDANTSQVSGNETHQMFS